MSNYLENYNSMTVDEKIIALELEIEDNEYWLNQGMTNAVKIKSRKRMIKDCKKRLKLLTYLKYSTQTKSHE